MPGIRWCPRRLNGEYAAGEQDGSARALPDRAMQQRVRASIQRLYRVLLIGVDAELARYRECALHDFARTEIGVFEQRARSRLCVRPPAADCNQSELGLEHVAIPRD